MARRLSSKIGDVYETIPIEGVPRYLQLIALDEINLNSDVVIVFEKTLANPAEKHVGAIVAQGVDFYIHTTVAQGVADGLWRKIGNAKARVKINQLKFKSYHDEVEGEILSQSAEVPAPPVPYPNWTIWTPADKEWRFISLEEGKKTIANESDIFPASDIIYRLRYGKSGFERDWPEGSVTGVKIKPSFLNRLFVKKK